MAKDPDIPKRTDADRRIRQADRWATTLRILYLLLGRGKWDLQSLAEEFECSARTIRRHLNVLEYAGVPYTYDRDAKCYRVRPDVKFPVLNLSRDELLEQATAAVVTKASGLDVAADAGATTERIAARSRDAEAELLADAEAVMQVLDLKLADHSQHREMIKNIQWALIERKQISGEYKSPNADGPMQLTLHPFRLCLSGQAWYLIARPVDEEHPKTFRVARFSSVRLIDAEAVVPEDFSLDDYFGNAWNVFRGDESYDIEIEFSKDAADLVTETRWHKTQQVKRHPNGRVTLTFTVDGLEEIVWWVLGWSGRAKVIKPVELRQLVVEKLQTALEMNQH
ncbi:MAG: WYL domain-containing protein [Planctomycetota bacterium]|nr:MAG: WYL domain-containing protein [Planctomycetota bacterium]REK25950.1 MAG: WYL domain-containing protein [Planctomycetota bacterium]REK46934.1 MAG: WYL domain-containing protein [Planctomycetota bacterium]